MRITHIIKVGVFASWCLSALALAQSTSTPSGVEFEFSVMGSDRMRDVGYAQIKADGAAKVDLLDDSPTAFPARHIRIVNLAGQLVQGSLNGNSFRVDQTVTVLPPQRVTESVKVGVAYERLDRPVVVFDQSLRVGQNERILLVFLPPFRAGADVRVRVVRDQVQEPNEAEGK